MSDEDMYTHGCWAVQADSQELLNRFLDEADRIARKMDIRGIPIDLRQFPEGWLERQADAYERDVQSVMRPN